MSDSSSAPLSGKLVIALEQAVAAPFCSSRLADAGARVIKVERAEGDFARGYDRAANGVSSYFAWLNQGKESIALDLKSQGDADLLSAMLARAATGSRKSKTSCVLETVSLQSASAWTTRSASR